MSSSIVLPSSIVSLVNSFVKRQGSEFEILRDFYYSLGNLKMTKLVEICSGFDIFEVVLKKYQKTVTLTGFIKNTKYEKNYRTRVCVKEIFNRILWINKTQGMLTAFRNICKIGELYFNVRGTLKWIIENDNEEQK
jgi:hypothetical protein